MDEVVLIYPKTGMDEFARQPLSVLTVAGAAEHAGYKTRIIDARVEENPTDQIQKAAKTASVIGLSAMTGFQIKYSLQYAALIRKENPNLPIVWGGVHASLLPEETLESEYVDYIVKGEGEVTFVELLQAIEKDKAPENIQGVGYKKDSKPQVNADRPFIEMEKSQLLPWHLVDMDKYVKVDGKMVIPLQASRGCPYRCFYCYNLKFNMRKWRAMSTERTMQEIDAVTEKYKIGGIIFWDDNFFVDRSRAESLCKELSTRDLDWEADIRPDLLSSFSDDFLALLRKSGCSALFIGAESGCQPILNLIKKDTTAQQIEKSVKLCKQHDIKAILSFMIGFPTETYAQWDETIQFMNKLNQIDPDSQQSLSIFAPFPGTESFDFSIDHGFKPPKRLEDWSNFVTSTAEKRAWLTKKEQARLEDLAFISRLAFQYKRMDEFIKNPATKLALKTLHKIERFRWEKGIWSAPIEVRLANWLYYKR